MVGPLLLLELIFPVWCRTGLPNLDQNINFNPHISLSLLGYHVLISTATPLTLLLLQPPNDKCGLALQTPEFQLYVQS